MEYNDNRNNIKNNNDNDHNNYHKIDYDIIHHNQDNEDISVIILDQNYVDDVEVTYIL